MKNSAAQKAHDYFTSGLNCAESVLRSVVWHTHGEQGDRLSRIATPFGGGVGGSREELCGALAGGVMAIGFVAGRDHGTEDAMVSKSMAAELRQRFVNALACTQCSALLDIMGPQEDSQQCAHVVAQTAGWVIDILHENEMI
ncbi:C_GCAxxG_C_C family protein [bacterium]|nr:C_GCAxxG_C_C family protein [bacterium]